MLNKSRDDGRPFRTKCLFFSSAPDCDRRWHWERAADSLLHQCISPLTAVIAFPFH